MSEQIKWTPDLSIGVGDIDVQHRQFVSIMQELATSIKKGKDKKIEETISFLEKYAEVHFNLEQMYMMFYSYPETANHIKEHKQFKEEIKELRKKSDNKQLKISDVNEKLKNYFFNHIKTIDMQLAGFLIKKIKR